MNQSKLFYKDIPVKRILICLCTWAFTASCFGSQPAVMTVTGAIEPDQMGICLTHEHLLVDFIGADKFDPGRYDANEVIERTGPFLLELKDYKVKTFIDCTPDYLGRDPLMLRRLAGKTDIQIITNTGYYGAGDRFLPSHAFDETAQQICNRWTREFTDGIGQTGVRPGFIKISVDDEDGKLSLMDKKLVTSAAMTHLRTGLTIASHSGPGVIEEQLDILQKHNVSPRAFVWVHAQGGESDFLIKIAKREAWLSLDNVSADEHANESIIKKIGALKNAGFFDNILISHDAGWYSVGQLNGGTFKPFTPIFTHLIPVLKKNGFTEQEIDQLLVTHSRNAFTIHQRTINYR